MFKQIYGNFYLFITTHLQKKSNILKIRNLRAPLFKDTGNLKFSLFSKNHTHTILNVKRTHPQKNKVYSYKLPMYLSLHWVSLSLSIPLIWITRTNGSNDDELFMVFLLLEEWKNINYSSHTKNL